MTGIMFDKNGSRGSNCGDTTSGKIGQVIGEQENCSSDHHQKREITLRKRRGERKEISSPRDQTFSKETMSNLNAVPIMDSVDEFGLRTKCFQSRVSPLDKLFNDKNVKSAYDIIASFIFLIIFTTLYDYTLDHGRFQEDYNFLTNAFQDFHLAFGIWLFLMAIICIIFFPINQFEIKSRNNGPNYTCWTFNACVNLINLTTFSILIFLPLIIFNSLNFSSVSRIALIAESIRLIFKLISFLVETTTSVETLSRNGFKNGIADNLIIKNSNQSNQNVVEIPSFSHFVYFLFVPTLLYRSSYPRTSSLNKRRLATLILEFIVCFILTFLSIKRIVIPTFSDIGIKHWTPSQVLNKWLLCALIGQVFMFVSLFYGLLHSWMNIFAELTTFADRQFYQDWWNATNGNEFHRKWNAILHDWIYAYAYRPIVKYFSRPAKDASVEVSKDSEIEAKDNGKRRRQSTTGRIVANISCLFLSGLLHDYIVYMSLGVFFPIMFIMYSIMGIIMFIVFSVLKKSNLLLHNFHASNFNLCLSGTIAWSAFVFVYAGQYFSNQNCPQALWPPTLFDCIKHVK